MDKLRQIERKVESVERRPDPIQCASPVILGEVSPQDPHLQVPNTIDAQWNPDNLPPTYVPLSARRGVRPLGIDEDGRIQQRYVFV